MNNPRIGIDDGPFGGGQASVAVIQAVSDRTATDPTDLPPLYESIDPDALDSIFDTTATGTVRRGRIEFAYAGCSVTISSEDGITVEPGRPRTTGESPDQGLSIE